LDAGGIIDGNQIISADLRPIAQQLSRIIYNIRRLLRNRADQRIKGNYSNEIIETFQKLNLLWNNFEEAYLEKSKKKRNAIEIEQLYQYIFLLSDTMISLKQNGLINSQMIDDCEPSLLVGLPRVSILKFAFFFFLSCF